MTLKGSFNGSQPAPGSSRGGDTPEHRCGKCWGPYGKSAIRCVNEPGTAPSRAQQWLDKRAEIKEIDR